jgi:hypothetical protein
MDELYVAYFSPNMSCVIYSRTMIWAGNVVESVRERERERRRMDEDRVWWGNLRERDHRKGLG